MLKKSIVKSSALGACLFGNVGGVVFAVPVMVWEILWNFRKVLLGMACGLAIVGIMLLSKWLIAECGLNFVVAVAVSFGGLYGAFSFLDDFREKKAKEKARRVKR